MGDRFAVIDIETTGPSFQQGDRMIQIGIVVIEGRQIIERFSSFINPNIKIPNFIQQLTGIGDEDVVNAPSFLTIAAKIYELLDGAYLVAHNVHFDLPFLEAEFKQAGFESFFVQVIDTVELARLLLPTEEGYKLSYLAQRFSLAHERPHQADSDAEVTALLFLSLIEKLKNLPLVTLEMLAQLSISFISDISEIIEEMIQEKYVTYKKEHDEIDIIGKIAIKKQREHVKEETSQLPPFAVLLESVLGNQGSLKKAFVHYEEREGQVAMIQAVQTAFSESQHALVEAGTGIGKTIAYLIPAIYQAISKNSPVVISTQTIPLQEQLMERDIPLLKKVLPFPFKSALVKGKNHYICLQKFSDQLQQFEEDNYELILAKGQLLIWLVETETGDVEELNLTGGGQQFWREVECDESCSFMTCSFFEHCFYERSCRQAKHADIIITNHALLLSDLAYDYSLLPKYSYAVIDEAHQFEQCSSDYLGLKTDYLSFAYYFNRLSQADGKGMLQKLQQLVNEQVHISVDELIFQLKKERELLHEEVDHLFRMIREYVLRNVKREVDDRGRVSYLYEAHLEKHAGWVEILTATEQVIAKMNTFAHSIKLIEKQLENVKESFSFKQKSLLLDFKGLREQLEAETEKLNSLLLEYDPAFVYWIEVEERGAKNATFLFKKPVDVSDELADRFFAKKKSVVLTSATLTVNDSFDYTVNQLGLADFGPSTLLIPSPFHYEEQAMICIPTDVAPILGNQEEFVYDLASKIAVTMETLQGKMLVLFTSFAMLKSTYEALRPYAEEMNIPLFAQGVSGGSRAKLMKSFKQMDEGILFGLSSFWEGIDLPNEELTTLVIVRLPFSSPEQPLFAAKAKRLEDNGGNSFIDLSLPQAVLRFKQGFGRLIRTKRDRGVVIVFDKRMIEKSYGKIFLKSLPKTVVKSGKLADLLEEMSSFQGR